MKILIACETSGEVREAFLSLGHDAWSCDILPADTPTENHIEGDVLGVLDNEWDLLIAHPPCTRLCNSGVRWLHKAPSGRTVEEMWAELDDGAELFSALLNADVPRICVENPVMHKYAKMRITNYQPFSQSIQPWQFAETETSEANTKKRTCLWLKNLPHLIPTGKVDGTTARDDVHKASPGANRWKLRSKTYTAVAEAMAQQWGNE